MRTDADCTIGVRLKPDSTYVADAGHRHDCRRMWCPPSGGPMHPSVVITARGEERLRGGHPWIYRSDVGGVRAGPGDLVVVRGPRGRTLGRALYSSHSQIAIRMMERGPVEETIDVAALLRTRIEAAIEFRRSLGIDAAAYRVIHGEADLLPSLIVDRYGDYLVVQTLS